MTLEEIYTVLNGISGFEGKVAYRAFPEGHAPALPFICYLAPYSHNVFADGEVYKTINHIQIELYSRTKDVTSESLLEAALNRAGLPWEKTEDYLDDERCFQVIYETEV